MKHFLIILLFLIISYSGFAQEPTFIISKPPAELGLDSFYKKYVDADGIPVVSSWRVPDEALIKVAKMLGFFMDNLPEKVTANLLKNKTRIGILARYEGTTDMPEYAHLEKDTTVLGCACPWAGWYFETAHDFMR